MRQKVISTPLFRRQFFEQSTHFSRSADVHRLQSWLGRLSPRDTVLLAELLASSAEMREVVRAQLSILPEEFGLWLSLVERLVRDQEAVGSNPTSPMTKM